MPSSTSDDCTQVMSFIESRHNTTLTNLETFNLDIRHGESGVAAKK